MKWLDLEIQRLRHKRNQYTRLGKRKAALLAEAQLRGLMMRKLQREALDAQIDSDIDACTQVYS